MCSRIFVLAVVAAASLAVFYEPAVTGRLAGTARHVSTPLAVRAAAFAVSPEVRSFAVRPVRPRPADGSKVPLRSVNEDEEEDERLYSGSYVHDVDSSVAAFSLVPMPDPARSFPGLSNYDNIDLYNALIIPPDTVGDVGPNHYVQAVNAAIGIFDKNGNAITPAFKFSSLLMPLGTPCSTRNDGDPTIVYDPLADRWIISQFCTAFPPFRQMVAISRTGDPAGQYFVYEFVMPNVKLNDYPKLSVWPDGYYMSSDEFLGSDYVGSGAFAFNRQKMLSGDPSAEYVYFNLPFVGAERLGGLLPSDLDGMTPPPEGAPNLFVGYTATEYGEAFDAIRLFDFHVDFVDPVRSTFRERSESPLTVATFDPTSPFGRADISQPAPGERLDSVSDRLMYRIAYRNFGDRESLVFNQTVRLTPPGETYRAGVRLYELTRSGTSSFSVREHSTIGETSASRWLGAAAQDNDGNLAVAYSYASEDKRPAILYSGRLAGEPSGIFRSEGTLISGTGVQKAFGYRWGDYSGMSVDPQDDCTFWITNEYFTLESQEFSDFTWLTRIGAFRFPECTPQPLASVAGTVTDVSTGQPVENARVTALAYSRMTSSSGAYGPLSMVPGSYTLRVSARGYQGQSVELTVDGGETTVRDFALVPIPVIESTSAPVVNESCSINHAAEPGESVTLELGLRNTGHRVADNLNVRLVRSGGIIDPGPAQDFGSLPPNGSVATRPFTFTISPNIACGGQVTLTFLLSAGGEQLGSLKIELRAGEIRYALREAFDETRGRLPEGWSSAATGAQSVWTTATTRSYSPPRSIFSPDPHQIGLNEVISPPIFISGPDAKLSFRNWYDLETTFLRNRLYDGSVLEISMDGGPWQDVVTAGGAFESGGYDGVIDACCQNPLAGRMGWSGRSGINQTSEFITSVVRLPSSAASRTIRLRWRVGTDIGAFREGQYIDDVTVTDGYSCSCSQTVHGRTPFDFDGDGRTDLSVFKLNDLAGSPDFVVQRSSDGSIDRTSWGSVGDIAANADFDGDGRTDHAVFRPSTGVWYILRSTDSSAAVVAFGLAGDRPVPSDYDGDGKADPAVFRPATGVWHVLKSTNGEYSAVQFGLPGDIPSPADHDADGRTDIAIFRPATGEWYVLRTSDSGYSAATFGRLGDMPVPGDFDGDGHNDLAVYRPSEGTWYLLRSKLGFAAARFGQTGDVPLQADMDGDGQTDIAVYRPSTGAWYYIRSSDQDVGSIVFGTVGDRAVPSIYVSDQ